jgi:integrase
MELTPAGLPRKLVLYCGRHDFGTVITARTGNLKAVMKVMGHKDIKTALRYQHPELDIVRAALNSNPGGVAAQPIHPVKDGLMIQMSTLRTHSPAM